MDYMGLDIRRSATVGELEEMQYLGICSFKFIFLYSFVSSSVYLLYRNHCSQKTLICPSIANRRPAS